MLHRVAAFLVTAGLSASLIVSTMASSSEPFYVNFDIAGTGIPEDASFVAKVDPAWAPLGAARFKELVEKKFYDDQRFFRVLDGMYDIWIAQFGMHGDPNVSREWSSKRIRDDPVKKSNTRGTISFAMSGKHTRTTQLFLNFGDCSKVLDGDFAPFAEVVEGMDAVDKIFKIGEGPPSGSGPAQQKITSSGNAYLDTKFPKLTHVVSVRIIEYKGGKGEL